MEERSKRAFDWSSVRNHALEALRAGRPARWYAFDFARGLDATGTYRLKEQVTEVASAPTVIVEGAYSASPPLRDLIDLAVLVDVPTELRHSRTAGREDPEFLTRWHQVWDDVEALL